MNNFGKIINLTIFGESHSKMIGISINGIPAGIEINTDTLQTIINERKPGKIGTTKRIEQDIPIFVSGINNNITTGAPITVLFENHNANSNDYSNFRNHPRPGHSDFTASYKYNNNNDINGGGMFSGRLTLLLVVAGYFSRLVLPKEIEVNSNIVELHNSKEFEFEIEKAISQNDSIGGIIETIIHNVPIGLGEPYFGSMESIISQLAFSIPGIKAIEFGAGFHSTKIYGSENNDLIIDSNGKTSTNNSGGINGGISNGNNIIFRVAVKPTSSIGKEQMTFNLITKKVEPLVISGRHDVCFALRVPPILKAISYIVIADLYLLRKTQIH